MYILEKSIVEIKAILFVEPVQYANAFTIPILFWLVIISG